ncbi:hypothetical protein B0J12DRAFT_580272, partial [Macrophomina phaseolina]
NNSLQAILRTWEKPGDGLDIIRSLPPHQLATGIEPRPCHSHNDYWRKVPLFEALAAGCTSVEADVWLDDDLAIPLVGHSRHSLTAERTLKSLYIDPIIAILESQYPANSMEPAGILGIDDTASLVLLLDLKSSDHRLWSAVQAQLQPLRDGNWLTYWDAARDVRVARPVTVVASGAASFDAIASALRPDIFFDAPLDNLDERYNVSNSHYASVSMTRAVGSVPWSLGPIQRATVDRQIKAAAERGLISRYWGTPSRPLARRDSVWNDLVRLGVGVLNGDDINCMNTVLSRPCAYDGTSKTPLEDEV